jgi:hypothetical protein
MAPPDSSKKAVKPVDLSRALLEATNPAPALGTAPSNPSAPTVSLDLTNSVVGSASSLKEPFKPDPEPQVFKYASPANVPRLPGPLIEPEFYRQWRHLDRIRGLPLVEDTYFLVAHNQGDGNCYWGTISHLIYGLDTYWPWVKAQHLLYLEQVMANPQHPRFAIYQRIITDCSRGGPAPHSPQTAVRGANRFTIVEMTQVTADLYDIYLILFNMDEEGKKAAANRLPFITRGSRNAPHKFMRWIATLHYEPMRPDVPRPSEYHFPDVTYESTRHLPSSPINPNRTGVRHGWRYDYGNSNNEVSEQIYPRPIVPLPSEAHIATAIGAKPQGQKQSFSAEPGYIPPLGALLLKATAGKTPTPTGNPKPAKTSEVISLDSDQDDGPKAERPRGRGTRPSPAQAKPKPSKTPKVISLDSDEDDGPKVAKPRGRSTRPSLAQEERKRPNRPGLRERPIFTSKANPIGTHSLIGKPKLTKTPEVVESNTDEDNSDEDYNPAAPVPASTRGKEEEGKHPLKRQRRG